MTELSPSSATARAPVASPMGSLDRFARRSLFRVLHQLHDGEVVIFEGDRIQRFGQPTDRCPVSAVIYINRSRFYAEAAFGGSIGVGESYMAGDWYSDDLTALIRVIANNLDVLDRMEGGLAVLQQPARKLLHWMNRNTRAGSRRNIANHYDLGNALFKLMLDSTLMYSCAIFPSPDASLFAAQTHRLDVIFKKLQLKPEDHLLEIGTGWGALAVHAAQHYGCRVTTTTISREQYQYSLERVARAGLQDRVTVLMEDYRNLHGHFDKLVSVEMLEAVGHEFHATFFRKCAQLLKPTGRLLLQTITIDERRYEQARKSVDFIQRYIFPGGSLPSITSIMQDVTRETGLRLNHLEEIGAHYAETLKHWRASVELYRPRILALGYDERFLRMWEFYLCYCEGGFREKTTGTVQMLWHKPA